MDILEELRRQADQVEVVSVETEVTEVGFDANALKSAQVQQTEGLAVRVVVEGRLGFAASSDVSATDRLAANALESAAYGDVVPIVFPGPQDPPKVAIYDPAVASLPIPRLVEMGREVVEHLLGIEPEANVGLRLERGEQRITIRNQAGADATVTRSPLSVFVRLSRVRGDDVLTVYDGVGATAWGDDYLALARGVGRKLELARRSAEIRSGRMPVLFSPTGALVLALPVMMGLDGQNVYRGSSPMRDRVGERLFDEGVTIVDDATLDGRFGSAPYDDEGVAHRRNVLVERGVLKGFLYDLKTAAQSGTESTGSGSRSLFSPPRPSPTNLIWESGEAPLDDLIAGIDEGLLVETPLGLGQGNVLSGAFSNPLSLAFKIERGEVVGRVKDVSIAGNVYEVLRDVAGISRESEWVYYNYRMPYILLDNMNVVAKQ